VDASEDRADADSVVVTPLHPLTQVGLGSLDDAIIMVSSFWTPLHQRIAVEHADLLRGAVKNSTHFID
jgi:hypothetical protein